MNKVFKTVWNAVRGQLVVVNETTKSHAQSNVSTKSGSEVSSSEPVLVFKKSAIALMLAGVMSAPCVYAADWNVDTSIDTTGSSDITWDNATVTEAGKLTHNEAPDFFLTINGTLTNQGTIEGTGHIKAQSVVNQSIMTTGNLDLIAPSSGKSTFTNSGTFTAKNVNLGSASLVNTGSMDITVLSMSGNQVSNSGTMTLAGLLNKTGGGKITNEEGGVINLEHRDDGNGVYISADIDNKGTINAPGWTNIYLHGDATFEDSGTLKVENTIWVHDNSKLHLKSQGVYEINSINVEGGVLVVDKGVTVKTHMTDGPSGTWGVSDQHSIQNDGVIEANYMTLGQGSYRGSGTYGNEKTWFHNYSDDADIGTVKAGCLDNRGTLKVANLELFEPVVNDHRNRGNLIITNKFSGDQLINDEDVELAGATVEGNIYSHYGAHVHGDNATLKDGGSLTTTSGATVQFGTLTMDDGWFSMYETSDQLPSGKIDHLVLKNGGRVSVSDPGVRLEISKLTANPSTIISVADNGTIYIKDLNAVENAHFLIDWGGGNIEGDGWFNNSIMELKDGTVDRRGLSVGKGNRYVISGNSSGMGSGSNSLPDNWVEGKGFLKISELNEDNTYELLSGGVLDVQTIAFGEAVPSDKPVIFKGGLLKTTIDQVFNDVKVDVLDGLDWNDQSVTVEKPGLGVTLVGNIKESITQNIAVSKPVHEYSSSGSFVFSDAMVSIDVVRDIGKKIYKAFQDEPGYISSYYTGQIDKTLTVDRVNALKNEANVTNTIFHKNALYVAEDGDYTPKKALYVGGVAGADGEALESGFGFSQLIGVNKLVIQDGGKLALIGLGAYNGSFFGQTNKVDVSVNGKKSKLVIGSIAVEDEQGGSIDSLLLSNDGTLEVKAGKLVANIHTENSGNVIVGASGRLSAGFESGDLSVQNQGYLSASFRDGNYEIIDVDGFSLINEGQADLNFGSDPSRDVAVHNSIFINNHGNFNATLYYYSDATKRNKLIFSGNTQIVNNNTDLLENVTLARFLAKDDSQIINKGSMNVRSYARFENGRENAFNDKWYALDNQEAAVLAVQRELSIGTLDSSLKAQTVVHNAGKLMVEDEEVYDPENPWGKIFDGALNVGYNGFIVNDATGEITSSIVNIFGTGLIENSGSLATKSMTMKDDATLQISGGEIVVAEGLDFQGGTIHFLGKPSNESKGIVATGGTLMLKAPINGTLAIDNAEVTVGTWVPPAEQPEAITLKAPLTGSTLIADVAPLQIGEKGKLAVGAGAKAHAETMTAGSAWFGGDSNFVIDTSKLTQVAVDAEADETTVAALVGNGKLDVAKGAKLHVNKLGLGKYYVTKDFAEELLADGSWADNIIYGDGVNKGMELTQDKDGNVILTVVKKPDPKPPVVDPKPPVNPDKPVEPEMIKPMTAIDNIFTEVITSPDLRDPNRNDVVGLVNQAINSAPDDALVSVIDKVSQIGADGGLMTQNFTLASNVIDQVDRHLSYEDVHFNHGVLQTWEGARLWANALGQKVEVSGAEYEGSDTSYDGENYGFIMGADLITDNGWRYGAAFCYQKGNMDSMDAVVTTSNKADAFSVTGYAAKQFGQLNVIGSLGYSYIDADLEQNLPFDMKFKKHTLHSKSDVITAGLKGEMHFKLNDNVAVVPYVGLRAVTVLADKQTSRLDGHDAFTYDNDTLLQIQTPIGVSVQGLNTSASGWNGRGVFDISMTPVFGDKAMDTTVTGTGSSKTDYVSSVFADKCTGSVRMGYSFEKGALSVGGNLGVTLGDMQKSAVTFGLNGRYAF